MNTAIFNNLRVEYSVGATVMMFSLIDTSINKNVLVNNNVTKVVIEYSYDGNDYTLEKPLSFHVNSCLILLKDLPSNSDITFSVYLVYDLYGREKLRVKITNDIQEHTLPLGNITYRLYNYAGNVSIGESDNIDNYSEYFSIDDVKVLRKMQNIIKYINALGTYIDINFDNYAAMAREIPLKYNANVATANAGFYRYLSHGYYGLVQTSGGLYAEDNIIFHELRHRYGITYSEFLYLERDTEEGRSNNYSYIKEEYNVIHDASKFETGREDSKVWVFFAHSNILEGEYTNNDLDEEFQNYISANYIKSLAWYASHTTEDEDTSKVRLEAPINITTIVDMMDEADPQYNINLVVHNGNVTLNKNVCVEGEPVVISNFVANEGYEYSSISIKDSENNIIEFTRVNPNNINTLEIHFNTPNKDVYITIEFTKIIIKYNINLRITEGEGTIVVDKNKAAEEEIVNISTIIPNSGYIFSFIGVYKLSGEILELQQNGNNRYFIMPADEVNIIVKFSKQSYDISLEVEHGIANLSKTSSVFGERILIDNIIPANGYYFNSIKVIDTSNNELDLYKEEGNIEYYYFIMPKSSVTIIIEFVESEEESNIELNNTKTIRKIINVGNYQYLCELQKYSELDYNKLHQFGILRNFEISNDIVYDKDIYFIDKDIYNEIKDKKETDKLCFPISINNCVSFSKSFSNFNFYGFDDLKKMYYDIYRNDEIANIKCDKIRIYNPIIKKDLDYIIYIDNYINGIHFHYLCNINSNFVNRCENEIIIGNNHYIEYIEILIPNIENIFNSKLYFIDTYNKIINTSINNIVDYYNNEKFIDGDDTSNLMYLDNLIKPYYIKDNKKIFIDNKEFKYSNNFINTSINITIYPYKEIVNNIYLQDTINPITTFIESEYYFRLHSRLGFDNNTISVLNTFEFPGKIENEDNYYDVDLQGDYQQNNFKDKYVNQVTKYYNAFYLIDNLNNLKDQEDYRDELDIENIRTTGYQIEIANDIDFKEVIFESIINTDNQNDNFIYDFSFSLDNIVNSWSQLNEILVIRSKFIDKRLNVVIIGNNVVITKEYFKYFINNINVNHVIFDNQNNLIDNDFMDVNQGFNFIDKINCIIEDNTEQKIDTSLGNGSTQIVYKPIFYKVQELQNLRIRIGVSQKIGINLGEYMNKIDLFILNIEGNNIKEMSRNDIYVIFEINANILEQMGGIYNILDQNFDYISSGNYILY